MNFDIKQVQQTILEKLSTGRYRDEYHVGLSELEHLDFVIAMGEEPDQIRSDVVRAAEVNGLLFLAWLMKESAEKFPAPEIAPQFAFGFLEQLYLTHWPKRNSPLKSVTKPQLAEFIHLIEFAVSDQEWAGGVNPFDLLLYFFRYLEVIGYPGANYPRRARAVAQLRKQLIKRPCQSKQPGYELVQ